MPILVDYSQVSMACVFAAQKHFGESHITDNMLRHMILQSLIGLKKKFSQEYGDLIICCDGKQSWRKEFFPYYKASRSESKANSAFDWTALYEWIGMVREELKTELPYKVIHLDHCEGDDVIAVLTKYFKGNELTQFGLDEVPQRVLIASSDKDFRQLQVWPHVRQYSPIAGVYVDEPSPKEQLLELIIKGDSGDGVPNVLSNEDCFVMKVRQTTMTAKRLAHIKESIENDTLDENVLRRYKMNKMMVDLIDGIPDHIREKILYTYETLEPKSRSGVLSYLMKHQLNNLAKNLQDF